MAHDEARLRLRARHAYERGRVGAGLRATWFVAPLVVLSLQTCRSPLPSLATAAALTVVAAALAWRGEGWRRALRQGLLGGLASFSVPLLARLTGHSCVAGETCSFLIAACLLGGLLGGAIAARSLRDEPRPIAAASLLVAGLTGSLGCALAGLAGVLGMALGIAASATPIFFASAARR